MGWSPLGPLQDPAQHDLDIRVRLTFWDEAQAGVEVPSRSGEAPEDQAVAGMRTGSHEKTVAVASHVAGVPRSMEGRHIVSAAADHRHVHLRCARMQGSVRVRARSH